MYRSEISPLPFVSLTESSVLEGYMLHESAAAVRAEITTIRDAIERFCREIAGLPIRFGAVGPDDLSQNTQARFAFLSRPTPGRTIKFGAIRNLAQEFSADFAITRSSATGNDMLPWTASWALSEALLAAILIAHGDDKGLILPVQLAPIQVVIIPIYQSADSKGDCVTESFAIQNLLTSAGLRAAVDTRESVTTGFKFNDWEMRGVPLRMELGKHELSNGIVTLVKRGSRDRLSCDRGSVTQLIRTLLSEITVGLFERASTVADAEIVTVATDYADFTKCLRDTWVQTPFCGRSECEHDIRTESGAVLCYLTDILESMSNKCIRCGRFCLRAGTFSLPISVS
jgi:prolyl-tRNA synthetase